MKPELSEQLFIEELFNNSVEKLEYKDHKINNIERLTGDASTRRYYRVFCASKSYVVCLDNPSEKNEDNSFLRVQKYLKQKGVRVPLVHHTNISKGYFHSYLVISSVFFERIDCLGFAKSAYKALMAC